MASPFWGIFAFVERAHPRYLSRAFHIPISNHLHPQKWLPHGRGPDGDPG